MNITPEKGNEKGENEERRKSGRVAACAEGATPSRGRRGAIFVT